MAMAHNTTCIELKINKFPDDAFSRQTLEHGGLTLYLFIALYLFVAMTVVIHAYLVSAIHIFADRFHIASYCGRNSIVIPGILLPEFFIALISVFTEKGNISSATVMGSCAANSLLTLGVVGLLLSSTPVKLSWYPLWRDNIFYCVAVTILLWTTYDLQMKWQECMILLVVYLVYLLIINNNHEVERGVRRIVLMYREGHDDDEADIQIEKHSTIESRQIAAASMACGCGGKGSSSKTKNETHFYDGVIPEEESGELSGDATDPVIDIQGSIEAGVAEEDHDRGFESEPSPFSELDGKSFCSNSRGSFCCMSAEGGRFMSTSECEPLHNSGSVNRGDSAGIYGSCGNVSVGSRDIYQWDERDASTTSSPNKTLSRYAHTPSSIEDELLTCLSVQCF